jgi:excisionase family DNA binding protein
LTAAKKYLTVQDLSQKWQCSKEHIYNLRSSGELLGTKVGKRNIRFSEKQVLDFERKNEERKSRIPELEIDFQPRTATIGLKGASVMGKKKSRHWNLGNGCSVYEQRTKSGKPRFKLSYYDCTG